MPTILALTHTPAPQELDGVDLAKLVDEPRAAAARAVQRRLAVRLARPSVHRSVGSLRRRAQAGPESTRSQLQHLRSGARRRTGTVEDARGRTTHAPTAQLSGRRQRSARHRQLIRTLAVCRTLHHTKRSLRVAMRVAVYWSSRMDQRDRLFADIAARLELLTREQIATCARHAETAGKRVGEHRDRARLHLTRRSAARAARRKRAPWSARARAQRGAAVPARAKNACSAPIRARPHRRRRRRRPQGGAAARRHRDAQPAPSAAPARAWQAPDQLAQGQIHVPRKTDPPARDDTRPLGAAPVRSRSRRRRVAARDRTPQRAPQRPNDAPPAARKPPHSRRIVRRVSSGAGRRRRTLERSGRGAGSERSAVGRKHDARGRRGAGSCRTAARAAAERHADRSSGTRCSPHRTTPRRRRPRPLRPHTAWARRSCSSSTHRQRGASAGTRARAAAQAPAAQAPAAQAHAATPSAPPLKAAAEAPGGTVAPGR